jgi:hypothetical protein
MLVRTSAHVLLAGSMLASATAVAQTPAKWRLEPVAAIEGLSETDPFGTVRSIALHADGRLVVTEMNVKRVSMFDGEGKSLGVVGRVGGGPGEYREPYSAVWLGDTLAIYDPRESRVVFLTNGKIPLRTELTAPLTGGFEVRFYPVSRSRAYLMQSRRTGNQAATVFIGFGGGAARDTVTVPSLPPISSGAMCQMEKGAITFFSWPEAPKNIAFPVRIDGSMALGNTGTYDIRIQSGRGSVASVARKDFVVNPLDDFMWQTENARYRKHVEKFGAASCDATPVRPPHRAPIRAMTVADNGDIWITVHGKSEYAFNVFGPDGRFRATLDAPPRGLAEIPIAIAGDRVAYVEDDRDGVQVVKLFRIVK